VARDRRGTVSDLPPLVMGKSSSSGSDYRRRHRHKHHSKHHKKSHSGSSSTPFRPPVAIRRPRISNFDRPPQPFELMQVIQSAEEQEQPKPTLDPSITKHARRIFIGNLPPEVSEKHLRTKLSKILVDWGGITEPGDPVVHSFYFPEYNCLFMELRTIEETEAALTLNGFEYVSRT